MSYGGGLGLSIYDSHDLYVWQVTYNVLANAWDTWTGPVVLSRIGNLGPELQMGQMLGTPPQGIPLDMAFSGYYAAIRYYKATKTWGSWTTGYFGPRFAPSTGQGYVSHFTPDGSLVGGVETSVA